MKNMIVNLIFWPWCIFGFLMILADAYIGDSIVDAATDWKLKKDING